eukprot:7387890-Prymnesium_polylepis.1
MSVPRARLHGSRRMPLSMTSLDAASGLTPSTGAVTSGGGSSWYDVRSSSARCTAGLAPSPTGEAPYTPSARANSPMFT